MSPPAGNAGALGSATTDEEGRPPAERRRRSDAASGVSGAVATEVSATGRDPATAAPLRAAGVSGAASASIVRELPSD